LLQSKVTCLLANSEGDDEEVGWLGDPVATVFKDDDGVSLGDSSVGEDVDTASSVVRSVGLVGGGAGLDDGGTLDVVSAPLVASGWVSF